MFFSSVFYCDEKKLCHNFLYLYKLPTNLYKFVTTTFWPGVVSLIFQHIGDPDLILLKQLWELLKKFPNLRLAVWLFLKVGQEEKREYFEVSPICSEKRPFVLRTRDSNSPWRTLISRGVFLNAHASQPLIKEHKGWVVSSYFWMISLKTILQVAWHQSLRLKPAVIQSWGAPHPPSTPLPSSSPPLPPPLLFLLPLLPHADQN